MPLPAPSAVQMFSLRDAASADLRGVLRRVAAMGYCAVEPAGLHGHPAREVRRMLDDVGLIARTAHMPVVETTEPEALLDEAEILGVRTLVGGVGAPAFESRDSIARLGQRLAEMAEIAGRRNLEVGYHNHWWEFDHTVDGRPPHDLLMELTDPRVVAEVDVYWVATAGAEPVDVLTRLGARLRAIHVKDGPARPGEPMTAVGDGTLDMPAILRAGEAAAWHIVELDECATDMEEAVARSLGYLVGTGLTTARTR